METPKRGRGRPRREGADEEILTVALSLLQTHGYRELTVDAIAERLGVAKTTIYRRWPTKAALIAAAIAPHVAAPDPSAPLESLRTLLAGAFGPTIGAIVGEGNAEAIRPLIEPFAAAIRAAVSSDAEAERLVAPLWYRLLVTGQPL